MANIVELIIRGNDQSARALSSSIAHMKGFESAVGSLKRSMAGLLIAVGSYVTFRGLASAIQNVTAAAAEEELAQKKLATALGFTSQGLLDYASALQQQTAYGDDAVVGAMALIAAFTKSEDATKKATMATLDLAAGANMQLKDAANLVSKTLGSTTNALSRYGITVEGAVGSTERLNSFMTNVAKVFGGQAKAEVETFSGKVKQLGNDWGDMKEELGRVITDNKFMIETTGLLKDAIKDLGTWIKDNKQLLMDMVRSGVMFAIEAFTLLVQTLDLVASAWRHVKASHTDFAETLLAMDGDVSAAEKTVTSQILDENKKKDDSWKSLIDRLKKMRDAMAAVHAEEAAKPGKTTPPAKVAGPMTDEEYKALQDYATMYSKIHGDMAQSEMDAAELAANVRSATLTQEVADTEQATSDMAAWWGEYAQKIIDSDLEIAQSNAEMLRAFQASTAEVLQDQEYIDLYRTAWLDANLAITDSMKQLYSGLQGWMSSTIQNLVEGTITAKDAVMGLGKMMLSIISDYVAKWVVSRLFMQAFEKTAEAALIASSVVTGAAVASAWAPAAAMASLASFGGNAGPAMAGIGSTVGLAQALAIPKLAEGGIVTSPTIALIGEKGPEAVVPLGKGGGMGGGDIYLDGDLVGKWLERRSRQYGGPRLVFT